MAFLGGLISFYFVFWGLSLLAFPGTFSTSPARAAWAAGVMFILVGVSHFAKPQKIEQMLQGLTRYAKLVNYFSGAWEILFAIGLIFPSTRLVSAFALIVLMVAVFPANINVARKQPGWYNTSRLFFQPIYIAWLWWCTGWYWPA